MLKSKFAFSKWQLALLTGILIGLSYPPLQMGFFAWFGLVPLLFVLLNSRIREVARYSFLSSITANLISLYWIGFNSGAGFWVVLASLIGAVLYLGLFWMIMGVGLTWFHNRTQQGSYFFPFIWVAMEWVRSLGSLGFPWINLAITQTDFLPLVQIADSTGSYGVSFIIVVLNVIIYNAFKQDKLFKFTTFALSLLLILWIYGSLRIMNVESADCEKNYTIAVVQPNIDPNEKWSREHRKKTYSTMYAYLDTALSLKPDLVLWPETALPTYLRLSSSTRRELVSRLEKYDIPLLSGTVDIMRDSLGARQYYNSSIFIRPDGTYEMYHKVQLVPFGEYIPLSYKFPNLKKLNFGQGNFNHGSDYTIFETDQVPLSNVICYESSLPQVVREFIKNGARLITIQANDGWLGNTTGPYQHFELARLRAVENRVPIVRSANTGISGVILPSGRVTQRIPVHKSDVIIDTVPIRTEGSYYAENGDKFVWYTAIIMLIMVIFSFRKKTRYEK